jgi:hypothetical protein
MCMLHAKLVLTSASHGYNQGIEMQSPTSHMGVNRDTYLFVVDRYSLSETSVKVRCTFSR